MVSEDDIIKAEDTNHDWVCRLVLMSCYLYYNVDSPVLSDSTFDKCCGIIADRWSEIEPLRQFQFGSADSIVTTGNHVKITLLVIGGARAWHFATYGSYPWKGHHIPDILEQMEYSPEHNIRWIRAGAPF